MNRCMSCMVEIDPNIANCPNCGYERSTPPREAYHLPPESILQGRYIVGKVLGYGGFGVTYIGFDAQLERIVAIKEFLPTTFATRVPGDTHLTVYNNGNVPQQFDAGLKRFIDEAQTLAQFNGIPGIVDIYDTYFGNNTAYIVMQFLKGSDIKHVLTNQGTMNYEMARGIILAVCDTLIPVHEKNIIHRDISPDNIYITDAGEVKLLDFGAARYESAVNSKSLSVILKSGYAPEEQYRSKGDQGPWTDVYALAASFYKMLTGQTPPDSMERAISDEIKEPSKVGVDMPQSAENALMNALHVRKNDRTKSIAEFKEQLLSDGVARVKVKVKKDSVKSSPVVKVVIAICALILVGFGIFAASGGLDGEEPAQIVVGGTMLEDNFGTAEREGFVAVPNLSGTRYDEAKNILEEAGLVIEIERIENYFGDESPENLMISYQEISAGTQLEVGESVPVTINMTDVNEAVEMGVVKDVTTMSSSEATSYWLEIMSSNTIEYQHSDTVPVGEPIGFDLYYRDEEKTKPVSTMLVLSAGQETQGVMYGNMLHGYIKEQYSTLEFEFFVSNVDLSVMEHGVNVKNVLHFSADGGASWEPMAYSDSYFSPDWYNDYNSIASMQIIDFMKDEYIGVDLMYKIERKLAPPEFSNGSLYGVENWELLDSFVFDQTINYSLKEESRNNIQCEIDSISRITEDEFLTAMDQENVQNNENLMSEYQRLKENESPILFYRVDGIWDANPIVLYENSNSTLASQLSSIYVHDIIDNVSNTIYLISGDFIDTRPTSISISSYSDIEVEYDENYNIIAQMPKYATAHIGMDTADAVGQNASESPYSLEIFEWASRSTDIDFYSTPLTRLEVTDEKTAISVYDGYIDATLEYVFEPSSDFELFSGVHEFDYNDPSSAEYAIMLTEVLYTAEMTGLNIISHVGDLYPEDIVSTDSDIHYEFYYAAILEGLDTAISFLDEETGAVFTESQSEGARILTIQLGSTQVQYFIFDGLITRADIVF